MNRTNPNPLVSICMIAYNVEKYVGEAIEGVLHQQTDFPFELVIGEDCSKDNTRRICEAYAEKYPDRVVLLTSDINRGIAGNAFRTWQHCRGKYIAICDGDDIWVDPGKLSYQVDFLEKNPDYGAVYSDVEVISETGQPIVDPIHEAIQARYAAGKVFFKLLGGNFVNNSTAIFRKGLIIGYQVDQDRNYYTHDYLLWLHIASQAQIHFMESKTTKYRKHTGGVTHSGSKEQNNRLKFQNHLPSILLNFNQKYPWPLNAKEKTLLFQKILSVLYRKEASPKEKWQILALMPRYFPGIGNALMMLMTVAKNKRNLDLSDNQTIA